MSLFTIAPASLHRLRRRLHDAVPAAATDTLEAVLAADRAGREAALGMLLARHAS